MKKELLTFNECPVIRAMGLLGSRWNPVIIYTLRERKARFGQIAAIVSIISRKVLTSTLKELEANGIVLRETDKQNSSHVVYALTEKGLGLLPVITQLVDWTNKFVPDMSNNTKYKTVVISNYEPV